MRPRILSVGVDPGLLSTRQALLVSRGYDCANATPGDIDEALRAWRFDLVILSVMIEEADRNRIAGKLPAGTKLLKLTYLVPPEDLFEMVASALAG